MILSIYFTKKYQRFSFYLIRFKNEISSRMYLPMLVFEKISISPLYSESAFFSREKVNVTSTTLPSRRFPDI